MAILKTGAHILIVPFPAQGHMLPLLDLTHQLANRGLIITIVVTPKNLPVVNPLLSNHPSSVKTLVLPFPEHPCVPPGVENSKDLHPRYGFVGILRAVGGLYVPLLQWFKSESYLPLPSPVAVLSDMFSGWTHRLACEIGIPRIVFSPSGALALWVIYSLWQDMPTNDNDSTTDISFPNIPNCPKFPWCQISPIYRSYLQGEPTPDLKDWFQANVASWGLVINSFDELEQVYLEHLTKELGHDRVWSVGPLLLLHHDANSGDKGGSSSPVPIDDLLSWLDKCDERTVVFVAFGSQAVLTNKQMEELALGLEKSGVKFIWCVKGHVEEGYGRIPLGFEDRTEGRGFVIKGWAPQALLLKHRAVGVFLTHCGWNSVLEAIVSGVGMLAWPMGADQFANATLLVNELKVAVKVCEGATTVPDSHKLIRALSDSVNGDESWKQRSEALRKVALEAVEEGGSSTKHMDDFVARVSKLSACQGLATSLVDNE